MNRACLNKNTTSHEQIQHASSIRPIKNNLVRMKKGLLYLIILLSLNAGAQVPLSLTNAIDSALRSNFDIRIAKINKSINTVNNTYGMAGGLPSLNASAADNKSDLNLKQKTSSGINISQKNVNNNSYNAGMTASIVLFNGFKIIAVKGRLDLLERQSELQLNQQIQTTMAVVMETYYDIIRQQSYLNIIKSLLDVSSKKLDIVKERYKVGMANEADLLQAQMDFNLAEQNLKGQELIIEQDKTSLLQLMGVKQFFLITINDSILIDKSLRKDSIINYLENNPQYLSADQQIKINQQIVKEQRALRYPSVRLSAGYNLTYNSSSAGFNLFTQNYGPTVGATLQVPIFNGNIYKTQQEVAYYNVQNARLQKENLLNILKADAIKTYQSYESTLEQLDTQQKSYADAGKLVSIVVQKFRVNQATILDLKAAQDSFESAGYMFINLQYAAKTAEIELKRLIYKLGID
jgi:outer membrane protein